MKKILSVVLAALVALPLLPLNTFAASELSYESDHLIIQPVSENAISLTSMATLSNTGDADFTGQLPFALPKGYQNLRTSEKTEDVKQAEKYYFTESTIKAKDKKSTSYMYDFGMVDNKAVIEFVYPYDMKYLDILVPVDTATVSIEGGTVTKQDAFPFDNLTLEGYVLENVKANSIIKVSYEMKPGALEKMQQAAQDAKNNENQNGANGQGAQGNPDVTRDAPQFHNPGHIRLWNQSVFSSFEPHIFMGVLLAILIAFIVYLAYFQNKRKQEKEKLYSDQEEQAFAQLVAKQNAIMEKILELNGMYDDGEISEDEYEKKMDAYKQHLVQVKMSLSKFID